MILKSLTLKNFKAFQDAEFIFDDGVNTIRGTNASGKSSLKDSFYWLLYGKDRYGRSDYEIKTRSGDVVIHGLDHSVTGVFDSITLTRTYREKWTRRRGDVNDTFTGHETLYFINENPVKKTEYDQKVNELFGDYNDFRILSDPLHFSMTLDWQKRRAYVMKIVGDVDDADVVKTNPGKFGKVLDILGEQNVEEVIASLKKKLTLSNKNLDELKLRVDETNKSLGEYRDAPRKAMDTKSLDADIDDLSEQIANYESGAGSIALLKTHEPMLIKKIEAAKYNREYEYNKKLKEHKGAVAERESDIKSINERIKDIAEQAKEHETTLSKMREDYRAIASESFTGGDKCYACGQKLPQEMIDNNIEAWREDRANRLKKNKEEGLKRAGELNALNDKLNRLRDELVQSKEDLESLKDQTPEISEPSDEEKKLMKTLANLREEIENYKPEEGLEELKKQREELIAKREEIREEIAAYNAAKTLRARLKELKEKQKDASSAYQDIVVDIELLESFFAAKLDAMEASVFDTFGVKFTLFNRLINGGVEPTCEVMVDCEQGLVPFATANDAALVTTGLKIIENLSRHLEKSVPVFIDNAEGIVSRFENYGGQLIRLVVDPNYETITMVN